MTRLQFVKFCRAMLESRGAKNCYGQVLDPTLLLSADEWIDLLVYEEMQIKYAESEIYFGLSDSQR